MGDDTAKIKSVTSEMDDLSFDPTMKKKKSSARKKSVAFEDPATAEVVPAAAEAGENEEDLFAGKKKKAKKILVNAGEGGGDSANASTSAAAPTEEGDDLDFSNLKKKKKKRVIDSDVAAFEAKLEEAGVVDDKEADVEGEDPFSKAEGDEVMVEGEQDEEEAWLKSDRDYTYDELLHRVFRILRENNPSLGLGKKVTLPPPLVFREGSKRTIFANIYDQAVRLHRPLDHFKDYLFAELGTNGSVDGSNRLILKGRFQQKQLENVVRRYIHEYVTCKTCKSPDTLLAKENRVWFISCESCGSKRSVSAIKTGFQAQTTRRRLLRNQAGG